MGVNLNNELLATNLKTKMNTGIIPQVDVLNQYVEQNVAINSYFAIGRFEVEEHILDYQIHIMMMNRPNIPKVINYNISITDETTGEFYADDKVFPREMCEVTVEGEGEDAIQTIKLPNGCMVGNAKKLHWEGYMDDGKIIMDMDAYGYAVYNGGSGNFNSCLKGQDFNQYSLPHMKTKGILTIKGKDYEVEGISWVDRQWQDEDVQTDLVGAQWTWTWMDINLENGDVISLWDMNNVTRDFNYAWATIMHPDGTQCTAQMEILKNNAGGYWKSPISNQNYPTSFKVILPTLNTELDVVAVVKESEIVSQIPFLNKYEGACTVSGKYLGEEAKGFCYVEMLGQWM